MVLAVLCGEISALSIQIHLCSVRYSSTIASSSKHASSWTKQYKRASSIRDQTVWNAFARVPTIMELHVQKMVPSNSWISGQMIISTYWRPSSVTVRLMCKSQNHMTKVRERTTQQICFGWVVSLSRKPHHNYIELRIFTSSRPDTETLSSECWICRILSSYV